MLLLLHLYSKLKSSNIIHLKSDLMNLMIYLKLINNILIAMNYIGLLIYVYT